MGGVLCDLADYGVWGFFSDCGGQRNGLFYCGFAVGFEEEAVGRDGFKGFGISVATKGDQDTLCVELIHLGGVSAEAVDEPGLGGLECFAQADY